MEKNELHASKAGECKSCIVVLKISRCSLNISRLKNYCWLGMGFPDLSADKYSLRPSHICCDVLCFSSHLLLLAGDLHNIFEYSKRSRHPGQQTKHAL